MEGVWRGDGSLGCSVTLKGLKVEQTKNMGIQVWVHRDPHPPWDSFSVSKGDQRRHQSETIPKAETVAYACILAIRELEKECSFVPGNL